MRTLSICIATLAMFGCTTDEPVEGGDEDATPPEIILAHNVGDLPHPGSLGSPVEGYASYDPSIDNIKRCSGAILRPGPQAFSDYVSQFGIVANTYASCQPGFHPLGQALDVFLYGTPAKQAFADWITANGGEMARRLGIVQVIWQYRMWRSYNSGPGKPQGQWGNYSGVPHLDHIHLSFGEAGAQGATSFYSDVIGGGAGAPVATMSTFSECGVLHVNEALGTDRALPSCDGRYALAQQTDGNLVLYRSNGSVVWSSGTFNTVGNLTIMQDDGNLVLYTSGANPLWATGTTGWGGAELAVQADGNLVVYWNGYPLWTSGTAE
jgi:hypothetical protein